MKIGNENKEMGSSVLACIGCGLESDITLTAFRNTSGNITGWIAACKECQPEMCEYEVKFQLKK